MINKCFKVNDNIFYVDEPHVRKNTFIGQPVDNTPIPTYEEAVNQLPKPGCDGHDDLLRCYDKTWQIAFRNL